MTSEYLVSQKRPYSNRRPSRTLRLSWLGLAWSLNDRTIVVSRRHKSCGVHLTVLLQTASGEIDIHIKREPAQRGEVRYIPIAKIGTKQLEEVALRISERLQTDILGLMSQWRKVRPGWLQRHGYGVLVAEPDEMLAYMREKVVSGKRRGKHCISFAQLEDLQKLDWVADRLCPAGILRYVDPAQLQLPLTTEVQFSRKRGPTLVVGHFNFATRRLWAMMPQSRIVAWSNTLVRDLLGFLPPSIPAAYREKFELVVSELGLEELPGLKQFIESVREFLANPRRLTDKSTRRVNCNLRPKDLDYVLQNFGRKPRRVRS